MAAGNEVGSSPVSDTMATSCWVASWYAAAEAPAGTFAGRTPVEGATLGAAAPGAGRFIADPSTADARVADG